MINKNKNSLKSSNKNNKKAEILNNNLKYKSAPLKSRRSRESKNLKECIR